MLYCPRAETGCAGARDEERAATVSAANSTIDLAQVQLVRKAVLLAVIAACVLFLVFGESRWSGGGVAHETIEWAGIALIVFCILGRTWTSIYIGGRKVHSLVRMGPYSVTRNPLYVFSVAGAAGAGAQMGSAVLALAAGLIAFLVFYVVVLKEEAALRTRFGASYLEYLAAVPRFLPDWNLWQDTKNIEVRPQLIVRTFIDACVFLLAIPLAEGFEWLHEAGHLPSLVLLP